MKHIFKKFQKYFNNFLNVFLIEFCFVDTKNLQIKFLVIKF